MKTILCTAVSADVTFNPFVVQVEDKHPAVYFCEQWKKNGGTGYVDHSGDTKKLIDMWNRLAKLPRLELPCQIDYVMYGWYD
jgi:hypothetical protein